MAKDSFIPRTISDQRGWHHNFATKLPTYATRYGISNAEVTEVKDGDMALNYWMQFDELFSQFANKAIGYRNELMHGVPAGASAATVPYPPDPGTAPAAPVHPDVIGRAVALGLRIKGHKDYVLSDGQDLGLEGAEAQQMPADHSPLIGVTMGNGGQVNISWKKAGMDALEIHKSTDGVTFSLLAVDTNPGYIDTAPMPAPGQSALWYYKAIYQKHGERVGQWSDVVSIAVKG